MSQHLLPCECGISVVVKSQQAGESITCECGKTIAVPGLRNLRELPIAGTAKDEERIHWTRARGVVFAIGFGTFLLGAGLLGLFGLKRSQLDLKPPAPEVVKKFQQDLSEITPTDAWVIWSTWQDRVLYRARAPVYLQNRARASWLHKLMAASGTVGLLGLVTAVGSTFFGKRNQP